MSTKEMVEIGYFDYVQVSNRRKHAPVFSDYIAIDVLLLAGTHYVIVVTCQVHLEHGI